MLLEHVKSFQDFPMATDAVATVSECNAKLDTPERVTVASPNFYDC